MPTEVIWSAFADELEKVGAVEKFLRPPPGWVLQGKNWFNPKTRKLMPAPSASAPAPTQVAREIEPGRQIARSDMPDRFFPG